MCCVVPVLDMQNQWLRTQVYNASHSTWQSALLRPMRASPARQHSYNHQLTTGRIGRLDWCRSDELKTSSVDIIRPRDRDAAKSESTAGLQKAPSLGMGLKRPLHPHEKDLIFLLVKDIQQSRFVKDIQNLRGLYRDWMVDHPRLVVDMLHRLPLLQTPEGPSRWAALQDEAQQLLQLISKESWDSPRILCRCLASAAKLRATPTQDMLDAIHAALRRCLPGFSTQNTVGSSGLLACIARLFPGSSRFDGELDAALQRVLQLQSTNQMTARQHSTVLWALARIGFQSSTVEAVICNSCRDITYEANLELLQSDDDEDSLAVGSVGSEYEGLTTEWQEEQALVAAAGFDLSWLPGGAPEHVVTLQAPLNSRLVAGKFLDINIALTSSSEILEASVKGNSVGSSTPQQGIDSDAEAGYGSPSAAVKEGEAQQDSEGLSQMRVVENTAEARSQSDAHNAGFTSFGASGAQQLGGQAPEASGASPHRRDDSSGLLQSQLQWDGPQPPRQPQQAGAQVRKASKRRAAERGMFVRMHGQQTLSNTVWALATFDVEELDGVQDAICACCQLFCAMNPQDVFLQVAANMAWAGNHHGLQKSSVLHHTAACVRCATDGRRVKPQSVANILYAMAEARHRDDETVGILTGWAALHIQQLNDQERANLAWACARLNCSNRALFTVLRPHVLAYVARSEAWLKEANNTALPKQAVARMCAVLGQFLWSYSLLGHVDAALFRSICSPLALLNQIHLGSAREAPAQQQRPLDAWHVRPEEEPAGHLGETILTQIATAWMSLEVMGDLPEEHASEEVSEEPADGSKQLVAHALAAMRSEAHKTTSSHSAVHDSICEALQVLGVSYRRNVLLENDLLCIQTLVGVAGAEPVAIIPNRGHDLTITRPLEVVGNAAWQGTQLRARGVRVVEVNGDSWRHLSRRQRAAHLQHLLSPFTVH